MGIDEQQGDAEWLAEVAQLLNAVSATQDELFGVLDEKRRCLIAADTAGLASLAEREEAVAERLRQVQQQRAELLLRAHDHGRPGESLRAVAASMPDAPQRKSLRDRFVRAEQRSRLLEHQSLTNWLLAQRTLIHLSQMLEIIATGGRLQPTYGKGAPPEASGSLVDQAA
jgi:hypothetical protein